MLAASSSPGPAQGVSLRGASWGLGGGKQACPRPGTHAVSLPGVSQKLQQASASAAERGSPTFRRVREQRSPEPGHGPGQRRARATSSSRCAERARACMDPGGHRAG